jgi:hypothetical protein
MDATGRETRFRRTAWHYLPRAELSAILNERLIRSENQKTVRPPERPVTWFSLNSDWEAAACFRTTTVEAEIASTRELVSEMGGGLARIGIDVRNAPHWIDDLRRVAGASQESMEHRIRAGEMAGANPWDWRFTPRDVPVSLWTHVEVSDGRGPWVPYSGDSRWAGRELVTTAVT